jgi:flagellar protein FlgJ
MTATVQPNIFDVGSLTALKRQVASNDPQALRAAAQQFEALFLQQVLKSMRDATPQDGMFDSEQTRMYQSMLDQQLSQVLSTKVNGTGLAALIEKQLARQNQEPQDFPDGLPLAPASPSLPLRDRALPLSKPASGGLGELPVPVLRAPVAAPVATPLTSSGTNPPPVNSAGVIVPMAANEFVRKILPAAAEASASTDIPANFLVAQAALESGWGKSEPRFADGSSSYNVFGIKAGAGWTGPVVQATTTEYVNGIAQTRRENFRAYASYADAFRDYATLMTSSPRYANVIGNQDAAGFARSLQRAGYASDPQYAAKLERVIGGNTLRISLAS